MEMPIQIIITLFIALAVGAMVLTFSGQLLNPDQPFVPEPVTKDEKLIEMESVTSTQLAIMVKDCFEKSENNVFVNETCYVLHSKNSFDIDGNQIVASGVLGGLKDNVSVEDAVATNSAIISWNFIENKVEVRK